MDYYKKIDWPQCMKYDNMGKEEKTGVGKQASKKTRIL